MLYVMHDELLKINGHGNYVNPDDKTCHDRFPLPNPLPLAGEGANESLREFHVNRRLSEDYFFAAGFAAGAALASAAGAAAAGAASVVAAASIAPRGT
jgi:hypothetical protein